MKTATMILVVFAAALAVWWCMESAIWLSSFCFALGGMALFGVALAVTDQVFLREFDTLDELKRGNMAVAVFMSALMLSFAVVMLACR